MLSSRYNSSIILVLPCFYVGVLLHIIMLCLYDHSGVMYYFLLTIIIIIIINIWEKHLYKRSLAIDALYNLNISATLLWCQPWSANTCTM